MAIASRPLPPWACSRPVDGMPFDHNPPDAAERFMQERAEAELERGCAVTVSGGPDGVTLTAKDPETWHTKRVWSWSWDRSRRPVELDASAG
jgi:hypothetical protein